MAPNKNLDGSLHGGRCFQSNSCNEQSTNQHGGFPACLGSRLEAVQSLSCTACTAGDLLSNCDAEATSRA